jgi:hypothetical protein
MESLSLAALKRSPCTRVVIMTGAGRKPFFRKSTAVDEVISKPFTLAEIDETIQNLSARRSAHNLTPPLAYTAQISLPESGILNNHLNCGNATEGYELCGKTR